MLVFPFQTLGRDPTKQRCAGLNLLLSWHTVPSRDMSIAGREYGAQVADEFAPKPIVPPKLESTIGAYAGVRRGNAKVLAPSRVPILREAPVQDACVPSVCLGIILRRFTSVV